MGYHASIRCRIDATRRAILRMQISANSEENQENFEGALVGFAHDLVYGNDGTFRLLQFFTTHLEQLGDNTILKNNNKSE